MSKQIAKLVEIAETVCALLEHPSSSVTAKETWLLRDALTAYKAEQISPASSDDEAVKRVLFSLSCYRGEVAVDGKRPNDLRDIDSVQADFRAWLSSVDNNNEAAFETAAKFCEKVAQNFKNEAIHFVKKGSKSELNLQAGTAAQLATLIRGNLLPSDVRTNTVRVDQDELERLKVSDEHLESVIKWLKRRGLYDSLDYQDEGPDFPDILTNHESELILSDDEERNYELGKAINRAAGELPAGYVINIEIERDGGNLSMSAPDDTTTSEFRGDTFADQIKNAINAAKQMN